MEKSKLNDLIQKARGLKKAEKTYINGKVVNVFTSEIEEVTIAVEEGQIIGLGEYEGEEVIDLKGKYVIPGLIDSHVHIESSMTTPKALAEVLLQHGVTTIIADPHEIANVKGIEGIRFMIEESKDQPVSMYFMLPSCVPSGPFETAGAILSADKLQELIDDEKVLGLGEMMNFPGVIFGEDDVLNKLLLAKDKIIDGHAPGLMGNDLNAYILAGVITDHECSTKEEMENRLRRGMYVQIREGSATKNIEALIPLVNKDNLSRIVFCTDDRDSEDLLVEGSIDNNIRKSISLGLDPLDGIKMATINPANIYGLKGKGAIAPGYEATFFTVDNLEEFKISDLFVLGEEKVSGGELKERIFLGKESIKELGNTVLLPEISKEDLELKITGEKANIIELISREITTKLVKEKVGEVGELFKPTKEYSKVVVIERHNATGNMAVGILKGYGITNGAVAQTVAHDSHNLISIGDNDDDIYLAIREIEKMGGGQVVVSEGKVIAEMPLAIGGIMSDSSLEEAADEQKKMFAATSSLGINEGVAPFMTLAFMNLAVIPEVKITDLGLIDTVNFKEIPIFE